MGDMAEDFRAMREYQRTMREKWTPVNRKAIQDLPFPQEELQDQIRVHAPEDAPKQRTIDFYYTNRKYHILETGERGFYKNPLGFARGVFGLQKPQKKGVNYGNKKSTTDRV